MLSQRQIAYLLVAIGIVGLLARLTRESGWLWMALVAAAFLFVYQRRRAYPFLVIGCVLMGVAAGLLLEGNWHWPGAFLVCLGVGFYAIDLIGARGQRWPRWLGGLLVALGVIIGLMEAGVFRSVTFAVILILAGAYLLWRSRQRDAGDDPPLVPWGAGPDATPAPPTRPTPPTPSTPTTPSSPTESTAADIAASHADDDPAEADRVLLTRLQDWRRRTAADMGIGEGMVLPDATLEQLVRERPTELASLAGIRGIGPVKQERYGEELVRLMRESGRSR